jgi:hypothetical protein
MFFRLPRLAANAKATSTSTQSTPSPNFISKIKSMLSPRILKQLTMNYITIIIITAILIAVAILLNAFYKPVCRRVLFFTLVYLLK